MDTGPVREVRFVLSLRANTNRGIAAVASTRVAEISLRDADAVGVRDAVPVVIRCPNCAADVGIIRQCLAISARAGPRYSSPAALAAAMGTLSDDRTTASGQEECEKPSSTCATHCFFLLTGPSMQRDIL